MSKKEGFDLMFKVILVGLSGVGKSNILLRYTRGEFSQEWQTTLGVEYASKIVTTKTGTRINLQIWDTMGQEKYKSLMKIFYKGSAAAIVVYDITKEDTFSQLDKEIQVINNFCKSSIITMMVGNKSDLEPERAVSKQKGLDFAESRKVAFYEVSAKEGTNVDLIFQKIAEELEKATGPMEVVSEEASSPQKSESTGAKNHGKSIVLDQRGEKERVQQAQQKKGCCP